MTVRELHAKLDSAELSEWLAYDRIEPLPDSYWQSALIASTVANAMGSGKKTHKLADFLPVRRKRNRGNGALMAMHALAARTAARQAAMGRV